jgi:hypothetical protein
MMEMIIVNTATSYWSGADAHRADDSMTICGYKPATLKVQTDWSATAFSDVGNGNRVYGQEILFTHFRVGEVSSTSPTKSSTCAANKCRERFES